LPPYSKDFSVGWYQNVANLISITMVGRRSLTDPGLTALGFSA
jgi:hypothetical protein